MFEITGKIVVGLVVWGLGGFLIWMVYGIIQDWRENGCWACFNHGSTTFEGDTPGYYLAVWMHNGNIIIGSFMAPLLFLPALVTTELRRRRERRVRARAT